MLKVVMLVAPACAALLLASACGGGRPGARLTATPPATGGIAFTSDRDGNNEIYVMDADGSGLTRLTDDPAVDKDPVWSPLP